MFQPPTTFVRPAQRTGASAVAVRETYRGLRRMGWSEHEAGNLAAHLAGLTASRRGWTLREVEGLLFIRTLVERGRLEP